MPKSGTALTSQRSLTTIKKHVKSTLILDGRSVYGYLQNVSDDILSRNWHNVDVSNIQSYSSQRLFKLFAANDTSFSASLLTHIRMLEDNYRVTAFKTSKERYPTAQKYLNELRERFDHTDSYTGFVMPNTIRDQISRMVRNMLTSDNAAGALFVNLQDNYEVDEFEVHDCDRVYFEIRPGEKRETPFVYENGTKVYLNVANFLWQPMDADAGRVVGNNLLRPALRTIFTKLEFFDNLRKVLKNQAWPKIKIVIDEKAVANTAPPEVKNNGKKLIEYMNTYIGKIEDQLTGIDPDQNIIIYDTIKEISFLESNSKFDPTPIAKLLDSEQISGLKTPPSVVGKGGSTRTAEGLASAELVIFRRCIKAIRALVETLYSRAYTLALRLKGFGGYAEFKLDEFSLRPPEESAQYDAIRQDNVIEAWIVGAIGDQEMQLKLRQSHGFDGEPPADAKEREDPRTQKADMQTERTPESRKSKEAKREETRKNQNIGQEKKSK